MAILKQSNMAHINPYHRPVMARLKPLLQIGLFLVTWILSFNVYAVNYTLPADIGLGGSPFKDCSALPTAYTCTGKVDIKAADTVVLTSDVTLYVDGEFKVGGGGSANALNNFVFNVFATKIHIDGSGVVNVNLTASGEVKIHKESNVTGDIESTGGDVLIEDDGNTIVGNVTAAGNLVIEGTSTVDGICNPSHPKCSTGGPGPGLSCETFSIPGAGELRAISGSSDDDIIAVGKDGRIYRYDPLAIPPASSWPLDHSAGFELRELEVISTGEAWAVGKDGRVLEYNGTGWNELNPTPAGEDLRGVWAASANEVWVVGKGEVHRWGGAAWTDMAPVPGLAGKGELRSAWGDTNYFYAAEKDGDLYRYNRPGGPWEDPRITACNIGDFEIERIWGNGVGDVYLAGKNKLGKGKDEATLYRYNEVDQMCHPEYSTTTADKFNGIAGNGGTVYAVGKNGLVVENTSGGSWSETTEGTDEFKDVWVSNTNTAYYAGKNGVITVCTPTVSQPEIEYRMDETLWNGSADEVQDSSGNGNHATGLSGVNTTNPGKICRGGNFDGVDDYIQSADLFSYLRTTASLSFWIKTTQIGNDTGWMAPGIAGVEEAGGADDIFWGWLDATGRIGITVANDFSSKSTVSINDGIYHHVVLTRNASSGAYQIYIDGTLDASGTTAAGVIGNSFSSLGRIEDTGGTPEYFLGQLDEVLVFDHVLSDSTVTSIYDNQAIGNNLDGSPRLCPLNPLDHFRITPATTSTSTCVANAITIVAEDASDMPILDYANQVSISVDTNHGNWSKNTALGVLDPDPDTDDNGAVSYTFDLLDLSTAILDLSNTHAETVAITVTDPSIPVTSISTSITFSDNAFTIIDNDLLVAGDNVPVAGRDHSYQIQMIRKNPLGCGIATAYTGSKPLKMWRTRNASDFSPNAPVLSGTGLPSSDPGVENGNISFNSGVANVTLVTADTGKFTIELADISNTFADITIAGTSIEQTVRPFGLGIDFSSLRDADFNDNGFIDDSNSLDLSFASGISGSVFTQAGEDFSITVKGVLWSMEDDSGNNGVPDGSAYLGNNIATPSFGLEGETVTLTASLVEPLGATPGGLTVNGVAGGLFNSFTMGSQTAVMTYSNVGIMDLNASLTDADYFLSGVDITGTASNVGRFNPFHYAVTASTVISACDVVLPFTYSRQPFTTNITLQAENKGGVRTDGYRDSYATLNLATELNIENSVANTPYDNEVFTPGTETFSTGTFGLSNFNFDLTWNMALQAETVSQVNVMDTSDEVTLISASPVSAGSTEVRFGRLALDNVFGSELAVLTMPMYTEYYNGTNFVLNLDDGCTVVNDVNLGVTNILTGGSSTTTVVSSTANMGTLNIDIGLLPPGGNTGDVAITLDLTSIGYPWLQFDWDGDTTHDEDPTAQATFGIYKGNDVNIYKSQTYQQ